MKNENETETTEASMSKLIEKKEKISNSTKKTERTCPSVDEFKTLMPTGWTSETKGSVLVVSNDKGKHRAYVRGSKCKYLSVKVVGEPKARKVSTADELTAMFKEI